MYSEVISKPCITEVGGKEMILYWPYRKVSSYVIFSNEGILYQENGDAHLRINPYVDEIDVLLKNKKIFSKQENGLNEFLFEFDKCYIYFDDYFQNCSIFSFNRSYDGDPIFTILDLDELKITEKNNIVLSYDELKDFLYAIDDPCNEIFCENGNGEQDSIKGKFVFSTVLRYANVASSELIYKKVFEEIALDYIRQELRHLALTKVAIEATQWEDEEKTEETTTSSSEGLAGRILNNFKDAFDCEASDDGLLEYISGETEENAERKFTLVGGKDNFRVVIKHNDEIEVVKFSIYCLAENSFEIEYEVLNIDKMNEIRAIYSNFKVYN